MRKILFLLLLTISSYGQTYPDAKFGTVTLKNSATVTTTPALTTTEATGLQKKIDPANLPISTATQTALNLKADNSILTTSDKTNQNVFVGFRKTTEELTNNYEFSMARMADGTILRAGIYSSTRIEQQFGAYIGFSKSTDDGKTWSATTTVYTSVGETLELPTLGVVGTRICLLFRTTSGGVNTYTNGTARTAYSDNSGTSWTIGSNIVSPSSVVLLPYGRIDQHGDGKYIAMLHNQNYCEAWETIDGINWAFRSIVYDYRSSPIGGTSLLIEPNCVYIGGNKSIIVARNNIGSPSMQFVSSNNLGTVTYSGVTNMHDGISINTRYYNPVALLSDNTRRILYSAISTRSIIADNAIPNVVIFAVSDLDEVFSNPTAYRIKYLLDKPMPNANIYNKGYHSLVFSSTGILGHFTETNLNVRQTSNYATSRLNNSFIYNLFLTDKPFDFKNITSYFTETNQVKNTITGNYDYITPAKVFEIDNEGSIQGRYNGTWTFPNFTPTDNVPIAQFYGDRKYFEVFRNKILSGVPLNVQMSTSIASGAENMTTLTSTDGFSILFEAMKTASVTTHQLIRASGNKPLSLGTSGNNNAIYINSDGALKLGSASTASSWLDLLASTAAHASLSIPTGTTPTTPASGNIWRPSASVLNFHDGSATKQFAWTSDLATKANTNNTILTGVSDVPTPTTSTGIANKSYVDTAVSAGTNWTKTGNDIKNNNTGNIEIKPLSKMSFLNSSNAEVSKVRTTDGSFVSFNGGFFGFDEGSGMVFDGSNLLFSAYGDSGFRFNPIFLNSSVSGVQNVLSFTNQTVNPTSGSRSFNFINSSPIINQTGGANGITRSIYINPTLTSAADFRAIEVTAGKTILQETEAKKLNLKTTAGSQAVGNATMVGGTVTINTTAATTNSIVMLTRNSTGITGFLSYSTTNGTLTINSNIGADAGIISYLIIN